MKIGYARVSTREQNLALQLDALTQAGCELIYQEKASGALAARVELDKLLLQVRPGDTVYIYKLDRLGRSLKHLLDLVADLQRRGIGLISLTDAINTHSAQAQPVCLAGRVRARAHPRAYLAMGIPCGLNLVVRARAHPRAYPGRVGRRPRPGPRRRPQAGLVRGSPAHGPRGRIALQGPHAERR